MRFDLVGIELQQRFGGGDHAVVAPIFRVEPGQPQVKLLLFRVDFQRLLIDLSGLLALTGLLVNPAQFVVRRKPLWCAVDQVFVHLDRPGVLPAAPVKIGQALRHRFLPRRNIDSFSQQQFGSGHFSLDFAEYGEILTRRRIPGP